MSADDKLSKVFDTEPLKGELITAGGDVILPETKSSNEVVDNDFDTARNNLHKLLNQGQDALFHALEIAKQSEHPRAFEVVGNLMKQLADTNEQLLKLSEKKQKLDNPVSAKGQDAKQVTNNAIFVGSTSELSNLINKMNKGE
jgi:multidrug efflux pump subunit AcrB